MHLQRVQGAGGRRVAGVGACYDGHRIDFYLPALLPYCGGAGRAIDRCTGPLSYCVDRRTLMDVLHCSADSGIECESVLVLRHVGANYVSNFCANIIAIE